MLLIQKGQVVQSRRLICLLEITTMRVRNQFSLHNVIRYKLFRRRRSEEVEVV